MRGSLILRSRVWLFALGLYGLAPASIGAHGLEADYRIWPGGRVQVECWFSRTLSPRQEFPAQAEVKVFRPSGEVLTTGKMDEKGTFAFSVATAEQLRVVIADSQGHRKELAIPARELAQTPGPTTSASSLSDKTGAPVPEPAAQVGHHVNTSAREGWGPLIKDMLVGVSFLLAGSAFFLSLRNSRALRRLKDQSSRLGFPG